MKCPCHHCEDREPFGLCHASCERYLKFRAVFGMEEKRRIKDAVIDAASIDLLQHRIGKKVRGV